MTGNKWDTDSDNEIVVPACSNCYDITHFCHVPVAQFTLHALSHEKHIINGINIQVSLVCVYTNSLIRLVRHNAYRYGEVFVLLGNVHIKIRGECVKKIRITRKKEKIEINNIGVGLYLHINSISLY